MGLQNDASQLRIAVVSSRWNELVVKALAEGALETLASAGVEDPIVIQVPGAWEIPVTAKALVTSVKPDAIIALGCILQGETAHAKLLASDVSKALMNLQVEFGVPISWGILTPDTAEQALDRAGMKHGNKGREAASAAIDMAILTRQIKG